MFKPCPNCGFLVALIAGREASQRCPRCGSALVEPEDLVTGRADADAAQARLPASGGTRAAPATAPAPPAHAADRAAHAPGRGTRAESRSTGTANPPGAQGGTERAAEPASQAGSDRMLVRSGAAATEAAARALDDGTSSSGAGHGGSTSADTPAPAPRTTDTAPDTPAFARRRRTQRSPGRRWAGLLAVALLALLLALQLLLAQREALAQDARWRPVVARACSLLGCALPPWREPGAFAMLARNVRPHPARADVLRVTATVRNGAAWPQPLPVVVLSLSDVDGRVVGAQAVAPESYSRQPDALVMPGASADIVFDVREPTSKVVSFAFDLR